jgi:hypothetical protein
MSAADVAMNFTDITLADFESKYAKGTIAALGAITGLKAGAITAASPVEIKTGSQRGSLSVGGERKLLQSNIKVITKVRDSRSCGPDALGWLKSRRQKGV